MPREQIQQDYKKRLEEDSFSHHNTTGIMALL
jgi:hypothetical protein